jgi:hypothetical protein
MRRKRGVPNAELELADVQQTVGCAKQERQQGSLKATSTG